MEDYSLNEVSPKNKIAVPVTVSIVSDVKLMVIFQWAKKTFLVHIFKEFCLCKYKIFEIESKKEHRCRLLHVNANSIEANS